MRVYAILVVLGVILCPYVVRAHDLAALVVEGNTAAMPAPSMSPAFTLAVEERRSASEITRLRQPRTIAAISEQVGLSNLSTKQVLLRLSAWPLRHVFSICFDSNTPSILRQRIASTIQSTWPLTGALLSYGPTFSSNALPDCPSVVDYYLAYDIRVGFDPTQGDSAEIGVPDELAFTVNFGSITLASPLDGSFSREIAHEMGHVLGLYHEQQNPGAQCKWNKPAVKKYFQWTSDTDYNKNMAQVHQSMINGTQKYYVTPFDKYSVMQYQIGADYFTDGSHDVCHANAGPAPDAKDYAFIRTVYGSQALPTEAFIVHNAPEVLRQLSRFPTTKARLQRSYQLLTASPP